MHVGENNKKELEQIQEKDLSRKISGILERLDKLEWEVNKRSQDNLFLNHLTPELNTSEQGCLPESFYGGFKF
jgi:hypothetical protein